MSDCEQLRQIVEDLVDVLHLQARELESLVEHVEQVAGRLDYQHQFSLVASELSELHVRIKKLSPPPGRERGESSESAGSPGPGGGAPAEER
jgi:hypothetical protein